MNNQDNPYKLLNSKDVYKNPWLTLREDTVMRPEGKEGIFGIVTITSGVSILPMDSDGNVYLIDEFQYAINKQTLLTISGGIDPGETPIEAARRELKEESGISAAEWTNLGSVDSLTMLVDCTMHLFLAKNLTVGIADTTDQKTIKLVKMSLQEAVDRVMKSQIAPAAGNVLILKAKQYLETLHP